MKVLVKNEKGEVIKTYKNVKTASIGEGVSTTTITRCINENRSTRKGRFYEKEKNTKEEKDYSFRSRIILIKDNGETKTYKTQKELADEIKVTPGTINHYLRGFSEPKGYKLMYLKDYEELYGKKEEEPAELEEPTVEEEIERPTKEEYYINILVGLANGDLQEGATYEINGSKFVYSKEQQALMIGNIVGYSREKMLEKVVIELPLLTEEERTFLKNLLKAFKNVKGIRKCNAINKGMEFIRIETNTPIDNIDLPDFPEDKYYANLKENRLYSIEELNL